MDAIKKSNMYFKDISDFLIAELSKLCCFDNDIFLSYLTVTDFAKFG